MFDKSDIVFTYTRKEAIDDGVLIDITDQAKESGFKIPVAVTDTLYNKYLNPSEELEKCGQSLEGRIHDMVYILYLSARKKTVCTVLFKVYFLLKPGNDPEDFYLKAVISPGDEGEAVITIMLPNED
jgi:uncharacterized protein DUF6573